MATKPTSKPASVKATAGEPQPTDGLVVSGDHGILAKVMTFRWLFRLEASGRLDCPIVGVAVDDWTGDWLSREPQNRIAQDVRPSPSS